MFRYFESPSQRLAKAIRNCDKEAVQKILEADEELCYKGIPEEVTIPTPLQLACSVPFNDDGACLKYLLSKCDPGDVNNSTGLNALHVAAKAFRVNNSLSILLSSDKVNVNSLARNGDSVLHTLVKAYKKAQGPNELAQYSNNLNLLLRQKDLRVNHRNRQGRTALFFAIEKKDKVTIRKMLESNKSFDVDFVSDRELSARIRIVKSFPDLENLLPEEGNVGAELECEMFEYLYDERKDEFVSALEDIITKNITFDINAEDGDMSLMQMACDKGMASVVECLLKHNGEPNATSRYKKNDLPSFLAAERRHPDVLELLLDNPKTKFVAGNGRTVLHALLDDSLGVTAMNDGITSLECRRRACFDLLMKKVNRLAINARDNVYQNTALHMATYLGEEEYIVALLKNGAYIGEKNSLGDLALNNVPMDIIQKFLDGCVTDNCKFPTDEKYELNYDFKALIPPSLRDNLDEDHVYPIMESRMLKAFSDSEHLRPILKHPLLMSYISLKWSSVVTTFFYVYLGCYTLFMLVLNTYIILSTSKNNDNQVYDNLVKVLTVVIYVMMSFIILWELLQLVVLHYRYLKTFESYVKIIFIVVCMVLMRNRYWDLLAAVSVLLSWIVFVLLLGAEPNLSVHLEMLKVVCKSLFKFLAFYSPILLAFALSFLTLSGSDGGESNLFHKILLEIYHTLVMAAGEYGEYEPKNFASYLTFLTFIFFVVIVIFNLLNGLAVTDTQKIKDNAELMGLVSRVNILYFVEKLYLKHPAWCKTPDKCRCCCGCLRWNPWVYLLLRCARKISLGRASYKNTTYCVTPNKTKRHENSSNPNECHYRFVSVGFGQSSRSDLRISKKLIKEAINTILLRKNENTYKRNLQSKIESLEKLCLEIHEKLCRQVDLSGN